MITRTSRVEPWKSEKSAYLRELFEKMNENNARWRNSSGLLAINETLYSYKATIGFKQCNPSKPSKYGLLYRNLCDSLTNYTHCWLLYADKPEITKGLASKYYVTGMDEYTKYLVNEISKYISLEVSNILMDRYLTSVFLLEWALEKK